MEIVNSNTLEKMINANEVLTLIDVRTPEEISEGMIPNASNINIFDPEFMSKISELDKSKTYVMICRSGARSSQACMQMMSLGFENIFNLEGGMMGWNGPMS